MDTLTADDIIRRRTELGLSVARLAREAGVNPATIWRWETGKTTPSGLALRQLAATFKRLEANQARRAARRASAGAVD